MNKINLLELSSNNLALPIFKDDVIKSCNEKGKNIKFWTPEGYKFRRGFIKWIKDNGMTEQDWYDKYYLNIVSNTQRPTCSLPGCNKFTEFKYSKSLGYEYKKFCCHSHCQKNNWNRPGSESSKEKLSNSLTEYMSDPKNRELRSLQTKLGFENNGNYDLDENGRNKFSRRMYEYHSSDIGKINDLIRSINLSKEFNPEFSNKMKLITNTKEHKEKISKSVRKSMSDTNLKRHLSNVRKEKFRTDEEFRNKMFKVLKSNSSGMSGYIYSPKCLNSLDGYVSYDSLYELAFIVYIENESSIDNYIREPRDLGIKYEYNEEIHWYWPDYIISYSGVLVMLEVKPKNLINTEINKLKFRSAEEYCKVHNMKFKVFTEDDVYRTISRDESKEIHKYYEKLKNNK